MKALMALQYPITHLDLIRYAGASGDFNELHVITEKAKEQGYEAVVAHGMYVMGLFSNALYQWFPHAKVTAMKVRFQAPTYPAEMLTITGQYIEQAELVQGDVQMKNEDGQLKLVGSFEIEKGGKLDANGDNEFR